METSHPNPEDDPAEPARPTEASSAADPAPLPTVRLFGISVVRASADEVVSHVIALTKRPAASTVITANLDHVLKLRKDPAFRSAYDKAAIITADGMPFVWLSKLEGEPLPARVTGSDLIVPLCKASAETECTVFLFGSTDDRLDAAATVLETHAPCLNIVGRHAPPFGFEQNADAKAAIEAQLRATRPDIVLVALGAPKQELWSTEMLDALDHGVFVNIGGGLDFLSGEVKRAPKLLRAAGLEWLWRAGTEPARLGPRYAKILIALPGLWRAHNADRRERRRQ